MAFPPAGFPPKAPPGKAPAGKAPPFGKKGPAKPFPPKKK